MNINCLSNCYSVYILINTFSNIITADVPVTVVVTGEAAPSYIVDTTAVSPQSVKVTGPASEVNYVSHAQINVDISNISTDTTVASDIVLINKDNAPMRSKHISCNTAQAEASVTFLKKKTVELTFETAAAEGQQGDVVCDIVPSHIEIAGKADIVDNISTINVGTIDVNSVSPGEEIVLDIVLPDGVRLVSGNASAKITVHSAQTEIATITSVPIDLSGMEQLSEFKNEVVVFSDKIDITVSGPTDAVNDISKDDIAVIADFSGIQDEVGIYDIPINIALDTDSSVTVSGMYTIAVEVKEKDNADSE